jgi:hypothetical protein
LDENDKFIAENGVDDRLTCLNYKHGLLAKSAGKAAKGSDSDSFTEEEDDEEAT